MNAIVVTENDKPQGLIRLAGFFARYGLLIFVSWQLIELTWWALGHSSGYRAIVYTPAPNSAAKTDQSNALSAIGLFGELSSSAGNAEKAAVAIDAPETRLQLELKGVVTARQSEGSGAIVAEKGREGLYYRVGDTLPGNAELVEVNDDRVLLRRAGKMETLRFPETSVGSENSVASVRQQSGGRIQTAEAFIGEAEKRLTQDPMGTLGTVGLSPVSSGESNGYVYNGQNPMLRQMNLQKGDVIRSINGFPIGDVQKDRQLLKQFYDEGSVLVEIERDGTFFSINYPLK